jgi:hypothetical protein
MPIPIRQPEITHTPAISLYINPAVEAAVAPPAMAVVEILPRKSMFNFGDINQTRPAMNIATAKPIYMPKSSFEIAEPISYANTKLH